MNHHRFRQQMGLALDSTTDAAIPALEAFMVCPAALSQGWAGQTCAWRAIYQLAYERTQAVLRPSRLERFQAVSWN